MLIDVATMFVTYVFPVQKDTYVFVISELAHGSYSVHKKVHPELFMNICDTFVNGHDKVTNVCKVFFAKYCG